MFGVLVFGAYYFGEASGGGTPPAAPVDLFWAIYRLDLKPRQEARS